MLAPQTVRMDGATKLTERTTAMRAPLASPKRSNFRRILRSGAASKWSALVPAVAIASLGALLRQANTHRAPG